MSMWQQPLKGFVAGLLALGCTAPVWSADEPAPKSKTKLKLVAPSEAAEKPGTDPYAVPDGTPDEIVEFINNLQKKRRQFASRDEAIEHAIKVQRAIISAGDKILAQKVDEDTAYAAAEMKMEAVGLLASADIDGALADALKAAEAFKKDKREDIAELGSQWYMSLRILSVPTMAAEERTEFLGEFLSAIKKSDYSREAIGNALQVGEALEQQPDTKIAGEYYVALAKQLDQGTNPGLKQVAEMLKATGRRLNLPGNLMEVTGNTLEGEKFDWAKYRGKVVLVDFWATWCGPCVEELPNVKQNYERFHKQGFEVVGISLDDNREQLVEFIKTEQIPWTNLFMPPKDGEPQQPPTAEYYGVTGIPTAILVDREGKVITLMARGEELTAQLEKLFAEAPAAESK